MPRLVRTDKERKPRKLTLSPTKINTYLVCKVMYVYTYIQHLSRFYYRAKAYHSFGSSLHRTLEDFHRQGGAETQSASELVEKIRQHWTAGGYSGRQDEQEHLEMAEQFLKQYHTDHQVAGVRTLYTEKTLKQDMGEFNLMGRIDRLDEHPDGHLNIVDYKSGRLSVLEDEIRSDPAMRIYAYLVQKIYPDRTITATIYCLSTGNEASIAFDESEYQETEDMVRTVAQDILQVDENTLIEPVWLPNMCPNCDYLPLCTRRQKWNTSE